MSNISLNTSTLVGIPKALQIKMNFATCLIPFGSLDQFQFPSGSLCQYIGGVTGISVLPSFVPDTL